MTLYLHIDTVTAVLRLPVLRGGEAGLGVRAGGLHGVLGHGAVGGPVGGARLPLAPARQLAGVRGAAERRERVGGGALVRPRHGGAGRVSRARHHTCHVLQCLTPQLSRYQCLYQGLMHLQAGDGWPG